MYSAFGFNGEFEIFQGVSKDWAGRFLTKMRTFTARSKDESNEDKRFSEVATGLPDSFAMSGTMLSEFNVYQNGQLTRFTAVSYNESPQVIKQRMINTLRNFRLRNAYEVPNERGACLPGLFIASTGMDDVSDIGVTFRMKEHPDVTIFFADRSAGDLSKMTSQQRNEFVWTSDAIGRVIHLQGPLRYRPTMMAGRLGTASFATVTRAAVDTPDLELLVQRTAKHAAKGIPPVSGDELERIAKAVAASVRRRPVQ
nr:T6SS immunity protein Tli4 family protein [Burkholderia sp. WSM2232]